MNQSVRFTPPSIQQTRLAYQAINYWFNPTFAGLEHLDAAWPALYVGNHTNPPKYANIPSCLDI